MPLQLKGARKSTTKGSPASMRRFEFAWGRLQVVHGVFWNQTCQ